MKVQIIDSFEIKAGMPELKHAPGLVVVFDASGCGAAVPKAGDRVRAARRGGTGIELVIGEVKRHGSGRSFFFEGLNRKDLPVGSSLTWPDGGKSSRRRSKAASA
ncbi:MAG TPA: hypothetical protein VL992_14310 [Tepidisphaeraceae bacterium]|nr:hypothetical protein [Tepidisphaeraceae bacterium]